MVVVKHIDITKLLDFQGGRAQRVEFDTVRSIIASRTWSAPNARFAPTNSLHFRLRRTAHCADIQLVCHVGTWVRISLSHSAKNENTPRGGASIFGETDHFKSEPYGADLIMAAERGEPPTTAGGGSIVGGEVSRNKRSALCAAAPIEAAEGSHPAPPESKKRPKALDSGGAGGIRTHVPVARQTDFESAPL